MKSENGAINNFDESDYSVLIANTSDDNIQANKEAKKIITRR